jgi:hypothetical protein
MEAHAGTISIGTGVAKSPRKRRLATIREGIRRRRRERVERAHILRMNGIGARSSVPGSEHAHLISRPRGF